MSYNYSSSTAGSASGVNNIEQDLLSQFVASGSVQENRSNGIAADLLALLGTSGSSNVKQTTANSSDFLSQIELSILRSKNPIEITETEEINVIGQRGVWMNRAEVNAWRGDLAISEYKIHEDSNPQIINKRVEQQIEYVQELAIRYLRPPTPPAPGEIVISMESDIQTGPAPPLIIRQQPARASTPEPLVVREAPPQPPQPIGPKRITISGKRLPPPPRKVVIERLAPLPSKPQNVIVERWLPYGEVKRRVIFNKAAAVSAQVASPRNVIVQWEAPSVNIRKEIKYLGVIRANPAEYVQRYGESLKVHTALPQFVLDIQTPSEYGALAANYVANSSFTLEGQLEGLKYINLDNEGLSEYRSFLLSKGIRDLGAESSAMSASVSYGASSYSDVTEAASQIFSMIDIDNSGEISTDEAEKIVLRLNSKLKRSYGEVEVRQFFQAISGGSSQISRSQFLSAFEKLAA